MPSAARGACGPSAPDDLRIVGRCATANTQQSRAGIDPCQRSAMCLLVALEHVRVEALRPFPGARLLDAGCGTGSLLDNLPPDVHYVGFDVNPAYLEAAERAVRLFAPTLAQAPSGHSTLLTALEDLEAPPTSVLLASAAAVRAMNGSIVCQ